MSSISTTEQSRPASELSPAGRLAGFLIFSGAGLVALGAAVLLPEYAALADLRAERDALAHQLQCERQLSIYHDRVIRTAQSDPVFVARLMTRYGNYRPVGYEARPVPTALPAETVSQRLLRESVTPPPRRPDILATAGCWIDDPSIKPGLALLGLGMLAVSAIIFAPDRRPLRAKKHPNSITA